MHITLSVIKVDIGSIGGHVQSSRRLLDSVRDHVAAAELEFEERPGEPILFFAADKTDPGCDNLPIYLTFADPMNTPGQGRAMEGDVQAGQYAQGKKPGRHHFGA